MGNLKETIMSNAPIVCKDGFPQPGKRRRLRSNRRWITHESVAAARANPGFPVLLNGGQLVDKAYERVLRDQAHQNPGIKFKWIFKEDRIETDTPSGKPSFSQMGEAYILCKIDEKNVAKRNKKARVSEER